MAYEERNTWIGLVVGLVSMSIYIVVILQLAAGGPLTDVVWWPAMLWMIGGSIVVIIVVNIVWSIVAGARGGDATMASDQRDRDIARMSSRVGQAFLVIAGLGVLVLCAVEADWFWIAQTMFFGFYLSAIVGGIAGVIAYRRGLV